MKVQHRLVFACATLLFGGYAPPSFAQEVQCLQKVQIEVQPAVWETIKNYFDSLSLTNETTRKRSRLTLLRAEIVNLESWKNKLIEIVEAHINGQSAGNAVSEDLQLSKIPDALAQLEMITRELMRIAKDGDLFAAENSFKELLVNLDAKRADTLCRLARQAKSPTPDLSVMTTLVRELKGELKAISAAEEALGKYIQESNK